MNIKSFVHVNECQCLLSIADAKKSTRLEGLGIFWAYSSNTWSSLNFPMIMHFPISKGLFCLGVGEGRNWVIGSRSGEDWAGSNSQVSIIHQKNFNCSLIYYNSQ